jgi:hypothetical protein
MSQNGSQIGTPAQSEGATECLRAVKNYRGSHISKWDAVSKIAAAIGSDTASLNGDQQTSMGNTYLAMLDQHDSLLARAVNHD